MGLLRSNHKLIAQIFFDVFVNISPNFEMELITIIFKNVIFQEDSEFFENPKSSH